MQNIDPVEPVLGVDCTEVMEAYQAIERPALEAYEAIERPALEAYEAIERPAWEAYQAIERPAWEAYQAIRRPAWEAYQADLLELDDPLVTWIAQNALPYHREEATEILRLLPATLAALDAYAKTRDWCGAWEDLREQAVRDLDLTPAVTAP